MLIRIKKKEISKKIVQLTENVLNNKKGSKVDQRSPDLSNLKTYFNKRLKTSFSFLLTLLWKKDLLERVVWVLDVYSDRVTF